jgi:hypothetical protein
MKTSEQLWVEWGDRFIERGLGGDGELSDDEARAVSLEMVNGILREGHGDRARGAVLSRQNDAAASAGEWEG